MSSTNPADLEAEVQSAEQAVTKQGDIVRSLKANLKEGKGSQADVNAAIAALKGLKAQLEATQKEYQTLAGGSSRASKEQFRSAVLGTLERRLFFIPSFKIYNGVAGLYDYGPPGCAVKSNITQLWRQHFVLEENMLEVECPAVTPKVVLQASGHVERFTDLMVTDVKTGDCHRADHLLEHALEAILEDRKKPPSADEKKAIRDALSRLDEMNATELGEQLTKYEVKAPDTKNDISQPFPFNLMFKTSIGPRGDSIGYLRPETAQGIFVNFRDLYYYNGNRLPFAAAQIGQSYRNEIAPRQGLLRVREFTQAEIEHFCNPKHKDHPKFVEVAGSKPLLYSRELQMGEEKKAHPMSLGEAVQKGIIANETLGYFIGRTYLFLQKIGIDTQRLRFRQHLANEMAHYAEDCWDAEIECSYGWIECVGLADRSAFDLTAHATKSKQDLTAREYFSEPVPVEEIVIKQNKSAIGKTFKAKAKDVQLALDALMHHEQDALRLKEELSSGKGQLKVGEDVLELSSDMIQISKETKMVSSRPFVPSVIEPSFGIGRIMYCLFEHSYYTREKDAQRTVFKFSPVVAPSKATVFPLVQKEEMNAVAREVSNKLRKAGVSNIIDVTGTTVGKRYARTDELGVPFGITIDGQTASDQTVTLRERDTTKQIRVPISELTALLQQLSTGQLHWKDLKYPEVNSSAE